MRKLTLKPDEVLSTGYGEIRDMEVLKRYFMIDSKGHAGDWPPIIVVKSEPQAEMVADFESKVRRFLLQNESEGYRQERRATLAEAFRRDYRKFLELAEKAPNFLVDGNHRAVAATLAHQNIGAIVLERDEDFGEVGKMVEKGELFGFRDGKYGFVDALRNSFVARCLGIDGGSLTMPNNDVYLEDASNIKDLAKLLVSTGDLPEHMVRFYKGGLK